MSRKKTDLFDKHIKYSIRKLTVGVASLAIGAFFVGSSLTPTVLADTTTSTSSLSHEPLTQYNYVTEDELTNEEKALIQQGLPTNHEAHCHNYYLIYRPTRDNALLPTTASEALSLLTVTGEILFVVLGLTLIVTSKGKKERIVSSIMLVTLSGTIFVPSIQALQSQKLSAYNQVYKIEAGQKMPEIADIPGYTYIGYLSLCSCQAKQETPVQPLASLPVSEKLETSTSQEQSSVPAKPVVVSSQPSLIEEAVKQVEENQTTIPGSSTAPMEKVETPSLPTKEEKPVISTPQLPEQEMTSPPSSTQVVKEVEKEVLVPSSTEVVKETEAVITIPSSTQIIKEVETVVTVPSATTVTTTEEVVKEVVVDVPVIQTSETVTSTTTEEGKVETVVSQVETVVTVPSATTVTTTEEVVKEVVVDVPVVKTSETVVETSTEVEEKVVIPQSSQTEATLVPSTTKETVVEQVETSTEATVVPVLPPVSSEVVKEEPSSSSEVVKEEPSSSSEVVKEEPSSSSEVVKEEPSSSSEVVKEEPSSSSEVVKEEPSSSSEPVKEETPQSDTKEEEPTVDKEALARLVEQDPELQATIRYVYADTQVKQQYDSLLKDAQAVLLNNKVTQEQVDASLLSLKEAIERLNGRLKRVPELTLTNINPDSESPVAELFYDLADPDGALEKIVVKIYSGDRLVKETVVSDFSQSVEISGLEYATPYTFKTDLVYNLKDGEKIQTLEHDQIVEFALKREPNLSLVSVEKDNDGRTARLTFDLSDQDKTVTGGVVKVYDGDKLVKEVTVSDFSQAVELTELDYKIPYSFKTDLSYDLRNGETSKTVSHDQTVELDLKREPNLSLVSVEKDNDGRTARLTFDLSDQDKTVTGGVVKVYDGDKLVKEVTVSDFSQAVELTELDYKIPYSFKTDLSYDLRNGETSKTVSHDQTVELDLKREPNLSLVSVEKDNDGRTARLTFDLSDQDKTVTGGVVKVYDGDKLVKEVTVSDFSQAVELTELDYKIPYSFKTDLSYDLRNGETSKTVSHDQTVELDLKREPNLSLVSVEKDNDGRTARLTFDLSDQDKTVTGGVVKVYDGDKLVKEVTVSDFSQAVELTELDYKIPYSFKTDLSYDLRNGETSKTVSHDQTVELDLKQKPELSLTTVQKDDLARSVRLSYTLTDPDQAYRSAVVKFYDGDKLVKEVALSDLSQPVTVEGLDYNIPYTIKTEMTYDIRSGEETETKPYTNPVELTLKKVAFKDVYHTTLYKYEDGQLVEQTNLSAVPSDLSNYFVKLQSDKLKDVLLPVDKITAEGDSYKVSLSWPEMVDRKEDKDVYNEAFEFILGQSTERSVNYSQLGAYNSSNQIAYNNIEKLLPLYNAETIINYGNKVSKSSKLYNTELLSVVPMVDNEFVTDYYGQHGKINRLMLHYVDNTVEYVDLTDGKFFNDSQVKEYSIAGTDLIYTPDQFIQDQDALLDELTDSIQKMDYFDSLTQLYPDFRYDNSLLIAERTAQGSSISYDEANKALKDKKVDPLYLKSTYDKVKENIRSYLKSLLSQEVIYATKSNGQANLDYLRDKLMKNKEKLVLGLAYVDRLYNVNYDDKNIKDLSLFRQDFFGQSVNPTDILVKLGGSGIDNLTFKNSAKTYQTYLGSQNGQTTVMDYLSAYNKLLTSKTDNEWFKSATKAYVVETPSKEVPSANVEVYKALAAQPSSQSYLLPLLTLSDEGIFIISNMTSINYGMFDRGIDMSLKEKDPAVYERQVENYKAQVRKAAEDQQKHYDLWYRIADDSVKERMHTNRNKPMPIGNWDGYLYNNRRTWMQPYGQTASNRMLDFFGPIGKWYASNGMGAYATGTLTHFVVDTMVSDYGRSLSTHEMTHNLDGQVYLGGYGRRPGMGADAFTTGFFESVNGGQTKRIGLNLHSDYSTDYNGRFATERNYNLNTERFQNMSDVNDFVRGMFDVIYTLDAIEGEVYLASPRDKQKQLFRRMESINNGRFVARNRAITENEWNSLSFDTLADLVNNQVVIATNDEYAKDRSYENSGYNVSLMFVPMYGALTSDVGAPDNLTFKRLSYELWAEVGYNGMLNYASNKLRSKANQEGETYNDKYILKETFGDKYQDFAAFKLDMLERRLTKAKAGDLKPVSFTYKGKTYEATYDQIKTLMTETVSKNPKDTAVLKEAIYRAYLLDTDDFRTSIYK